MNESTISSTSLSDTSNIAYLNQSENVTAGWTFDTLSTSFTTAINANGGLTTTSTNQALNFSVDGSGDYVFTDDDDTNMQIVSTITSDVSVNPLSVTLTDNANASTGTIYVADITNNDNSTNTGIPDALLRLNNANTAETLSQGLRIEQTGAGTLTSAISILETAGTITTGISIGDNVGTGISLGSGLTTGISVGSGGIGVNAGGITISAGALAVNSDSITSDGVLTIDATNAVVLGTGTDGFRVDETWSDSTSGFTGTARPTVQVSLVPEFEGAVMTGDGGGDNVGTLTSDFCSGSSLRNINASICAASEEHNYYTWTTTTSGNDYDIWVRWQVPTDFGTFSGVTNAVQAYGWRTNATVNDVQVSLYDTTGTADATNISVATGTAVWTQTTVDTTPSGTYTPGSYATFRIIMNADASSYVRIGEISVKYKAKF